MLGFFFIVVMLIGFFTLLRWARRGFIWIVRKCR